MGKPSLFNLRKTLLSGAAIAGLCFGCAGSANAAGFFVQELSTSGAGTSYAGQTATSRDASIIFHNPAGIAFLDGAQVNVGVHALYTDADITDIGSTGGAAAFNQDGGNPGGLSTIPNLYAATPITDDGRVWAGIGVTSPFGLGVDYDDNFFGAFTAEKVRLRTIDVTPTLAIRLADNFSIGASVIIQHGDLNFQQRAFNGSLVRATGDDVAYGFKIAAQYKPTEDLTLGAHYRSRTNLDFDGDINAVAAFGIGAGGATGTLNLPDIANFGVAYDLDDKLTLLAGVDWYGWSTTDSTAIVPETGPNLTVNFSYESTVNFNIGAEYQYSDELVLRTGYQYDNTPTVGSTRSFVNPDGNRHWFSVGATQQYSEKISLDYAATYILVDDANIAQTRPGGVTVLGESDNTAFIGSVGLNYRF